MECGPAASVEIENVATPPGFSATGGPSGVPKSAKFNVPVGAKPEPDAVTVAVKVTLFPAGAGFSDEARVVVVGTTRWATVACACAAYSSLSTLSCSVIESG